MIPTVLRGLLLLLLFMPLADGETLEDAVRTLARLISPHLAPGEPLRIVSRNISSLPAAEATLAQNTLARSLRRNLAGSASAELIFTISENLQGYLLVAQMERNGERWVEMTRYHAAPAARSAKPALTRRLVWEQEDAILDLWMAGDRMIVLDTSGVTLYAQQESTWRREASQSIGQPAVRDPRGRIVVQDKRFVAYLPELTCRGSWTPPLELTCTPGSETFPLQDTDVRFTPARNTLEAEGWLAFYAVAQVEEQARPLHLFADADGRAHLYDADRKPAAILDGLGSDFLGMPSTCGGGHWILSTGPADQESTDTVAVWEIANRKAQELGGRVELPGPVSALWPAPQGAFVIVCNQNSGRYAAYLLTVDCGL
jgi:hypothetical protein